MRASVLTVLALLPPGCGAFERPSSRASVRSAPPLRVERPREPAAARPPELVAMGGQPSELVAASWVAGLALASEVVQYLNTAALVLIFQRMTGARSAIGFVDALSAFFGRLGSAAVPAYALMLVAISVVPLLSAMLFILVAGMIFGPVVGTLVVSLSLSSSAVLAWALARLVAKRQAFTLDDLSPRAATVDRAIATRPARTQLLLVWLLRLSPVMPFTFSNYLAGLTSVPPAVFFLGTLLGTLPTQAVYVTAGSLGRQALEGGLSVPLPVVVAGGLATVGAIVMVGRISTQVSQKAMQDIAPEDGKKRRGGA